MQNRKLQKQYLEREQAIFDQRRQACLSVLDKFEALDKEKVLVMVMGTHRRLGERCVFRDFNDDLMRMITNRRK